MALPATGGSYAQTIQSGLNPLQVRYGQLVGVFIRDYLKADGTPNNLADPACGLGPQGVFSPFAADGNIRTDLLWSANGGTSNQGWFNIGLTKEDSISIDPSQTVQQTPSGQYIRTVRNVLTKLEDKVTFTPLENNNTVKRLRFELPLTGWTPDDGVLNSQLVRPNTDSLIERQVILFLIDGNDLIAEVYPRVSSDKKGKIGMERKNAYAPELSYDVEPDPVSRAAMWICETGTAWTAEGAFEFETTPPAVTPVTGLKANIVVPTPSDLTSPTYTVALQATAGGSWSSATLQGSPSSASGFTTVVITGLTASQQYNAAQVTATASGTTVTSPPSAPFTATAS